MELVDLHNHTTSSDGLYSPGKLVAIAKTKGLCGIGITDHDTTNGVPEALEAGKKFGVEIVPGIELNTHFGNKEIHILGYFIEYEKPWFQDILANIRNSRFERAQKMVANLQRIYGMAIGFEDVLYKAGGGGNIGRAHIARVLVDKAIVGNIGEAFKEYIGENCIAYEKRYKVEVAEGIDLIKRAGGVPVIAHPGLLEDDTIVQDLISHGIAGIEAYHSKHTREQSDIYVEYAIKNGLIITGGSDCHGDQNLMVGDVRVHRKTIDELWNYAKSIR
ncbi:MAG: PHP domain-containing protein [Clostridiales bacterium]|nr:PHP domain-containing protein [Clostridiales bacterium]